MRTWTRESLWVHRLAVFTACSTAVLIFVGGLVTSTESGLAVPDWPLSYGMLFPPMVGGIFYEHGHRMVATFVGFVTVLLTISILLNEQRRWVRRLTVIALASVILQGVLGGLTVLFLLPTPISVAHACLAQTFFCLTVALALFTSPNWRRGLPLGGDVDERPPLAVLCAMTTGAVYLQLLIGALMRHTKSGLAIPDFPLAFGRIIPPLDSEAVVIHFAHRMGALVVAALIGWTFFRIARGYRRYPKLFRPALALAILVVVQVTLGALTIWTSKAVLPTTAHVAVGALILGTSLLLTLNTWGAKIKDTGLRLNDEEFSESLISHSSSCIEGPAWK